MNDRPAIDTTEAGTDRPEAIAAWQQARIEAGIAAADAGDVIPAEEVFAAIAARHGWAR